MTGRRPQAVHLFVSIPNPIQFPSGLLEQPRTSCIASGYTEKEKSVYLFEVSVPVVDFLPQLGFDFKLGVSRCSFEFCWVPVSVAGICTNLHVSVPRREEAFGHNPGVKCAS